MSAAWLIEHAGFGKGFGLPGSASLSTKHTLALTNRGEATADDVLALARDVRDGVRTPSVSSWCPSRFWWAAPSESGRRRAGRCGRSARQPVVDAGQQAFPVTSGGAVDPSMEYRAS